jgi:hypothetical protein
MVLTLSTQRSVAQGMFDRYLSAYIPAVSSPLIRMLNTPGEFGADSIQQARRKSRRAKVQRRR